MMCVCRRLHKTVCQTTWGKSHAKPQDENQCVVRVHTLQSVQREKIIFPLHAEDTWGVMGELITERQVHIGDLLTFWKKKKSEECSA